MAAPSPVPRMHTGDDGTKSGCGRGLPRTGGAALGDPAGEHGRPGGGCAETNTWERVQIRLGRVSQGAAQLGRGLPADCTLPWTRGGQSWRRIGGVVIASHRQAVWPREGVSLWMRHTSRVWAVVVAVSASVSVRRRSRNSREAHMRTAEWVRGQGQWRSDERLHQAPTSSYHWSTLALAYLGSHLSLLSPAYIPCCASRLEPCANMQ